jgi:hypothetical protein
MDFHGIPAQGEALTAQAYGQAHAQTDRLPFWQRALSRRQFTQTSAGVALAGAALGARLWRPGLAASHRLHEPVPIPGGFQAGRQTLHVFGPGLNDNPPDQEPATITDFNGFIGLAYLNGMVTQTNRQTGETRQLPFLTSDTTLVRQASRYAGLGPRLLRRGLWKG